jgi:hypothetical protein
MRGSSGTSYDGSLQERAETISISTDYLSLFLCASTINRSYRRVTTGQRDDIDFPSFLLS